MPAVGAPTGRTAAELPRLVPRRTADPSPRRVGARAAAAGTACGAERLRRPAAASAVAVADLTADVWPGVPGRSVARGLSDGAADVGGADGLPHAGLGESHLAVRHLRSRTRGFQLLPQPPLPDVCGPARARWLDRMLADVLPVPYFHLVFTLPHHLSTLTLANRAGGVQPAVPRGLAGVAPAGRGPAHLGAAVGAVFVLHTWGQALGQHAHLHVVVPGGGCPRTERGGCPAARGSTSSATRRWAGCFRGKFLAV